MTPEACGGTVRADRERPPAWRRGPGFRRLGSRTTHCLRSPGVHAERRLGTVPLTSRHGRRSQSAVDDSEALTERAGGGADEPAGRTALRRRALDRRRVAPGGPGAWPPGLQPAAAGGQSSLRTRNPPNSSTKNSTVSQPRLVSMKRLIGDAEPPEQRGDREEAHAAADHRGDCEGRKIEPGDAARDRDHLVGERRQAGAEDDPGAPVVVARLELGEALEVAVELRGSAGRASRTAARRSHSRKGRRSPSSRCTRRRSARRGKVPRAPSGSAARPAGSGTPSSRRTRSVPASTAHKASPPAPSTSRRARAASRHARRPAWPASRPPPRPASSSARSAQALLSSRGAVAARIRVGRDPPRPGKARWPRPALADGADRHKVVRARQDRRAGLTGS